MRQLAALHAVTAGKRPAFNSTKIALVLHVMCKEWQKQMLPAR